MKFKPTEAKNNIKPTDDYNFMLRALGTAARRHVLWKVQGRATVLTPIWVVCYEEKIKMNLYRKQTSFSSPGWNTFSKYSPQSEGERGGIQQLESMKYHDATQKYGTCMLFSLFFFIYFFCICCNLEIHAFWEGVKYIWYTNQSLTVSCFLSQSLKFSF